MRSVGDRRRLCLSFVLRGQVWRKEGEEGSLPCTVEREGELLRKGDWGWCFLLLLLPFVSSAIKLSWSSEYSRIVCAIFIFLTDVYSFSLGEELALDFVACVCCVDPVLSHLLFHCSVYVCVCFFFFSGCCFFGPLHGSITELLVLLPSWCCCTRRSFFLAESGWLMTDVCHRCPWLLQTNSIDAFFRCNWCGALRKRCFAVKVKKSRYGDGTVTVVVSLNSFASRCCCFVSRLASDHLVEVVRFSSLFSLAVGLWWMRFLYVWHAVVRLRCVNFVCVPRALQAVRFPIEKLVVGMVMDVVLWDAAVGVSVVLVSVFAIFVVSLSS